MFAARMSERKGKITGNELIHPGFYRYKSGFSCMLF